MNSNLEYSNLILLRSNRVISTAESKGSPESFQAPNAAGKLREVDSITDVRSLAGDAASNFKSMFCK